MPWFACPNPACRNPVHAPGLIANTLQRALADAVRAFYAPPQAGGAARTVEQYERLVQHVSYLWRLFDIPPFMDEDERRLWARAARFVDPNGRYRSAEEVEAARRRVRAMRARGGSTPRIPTNAVVLGEGENETDSVHKTLYDVARSTVVGRKELQRFLVHLSSLNFSDDNPLIDIFT